MKNLLHYTACGLPNVWLENGYTKKETKYGIAVSVNDIDELHKLLASKLIEKSGLLAGYEFRFLRVQLGLTQEGLGKFLDVSENAVSLWERKDSVPIVYDHMVRLMVMAKFNGNTKISEAIERVQTVEKLAYQRYVVRGVDGKRHIEVVKSTKAANDKLLEAV
jgi:DNA-binding transcriptional regulator YiaG